MSEMDDLKAEIEMLKSEIALKVNADGVIDAINISPEGIRIKGDKIEIDSETLIGSDVIDTKGIADAVERHVAKNQQKNGRFS